MKRLWCIATLFVLILQFGMGQQRQATISFKQTDFDFGKIKEADGIVSHVFEFINTGGTLLVIQDVQSSCGCTTPEYSKAPVKPGEKGIIKAVFDPSGRPGTFTKEITIKSSAANSPVLLKITGVVIPREPTLEEQFRYTMGSLKLQSSHIGFGRISPGTIKTETIKILNPGKEPVKVSFNQVPLFLKAKAKPETLKPGQTGEIEVSYDAAKKKDWGFLIDYLYFSLNGQNNADYKVTITAEIVEDFEKLTPEQKEKAPKISFDNPNYNFGSVNAGTKVEYNFQFTNKGKTDLIIRKISSTCGCTTSSPKDNVIKPGATSSINVVFNTTGYRNAQTKVVTVISNDPTSPNITLWLKGTVQ